MESTQNVMRCYSWHSLVGREGGLGDPSLLSWAALLPRSPDSKAAAGTRTVRMGSGSISVVLVPDELLLMNAASARLPGLRDGQKPTSLSPTKVPLEGSYRGRLEVSCCLLVPPVMNPGPPKSVEGLLMVVKPPWFAETPTPLLLMRLLPATSWLLLLPALPMAALLLLLLLLLGHPGLLLMDLTVVGLTFGRVAAVVPWDMPGPPLGPDDTGVETQRPPQPPKVC